MDRGRKKGKIPTSEEHERDQHVRLCTAVWYAFVFTLVSDDSPLHAFTHICWAGQAGIYGHSQSRPSVYSSFPSRERGGDEDGVSWRECVSCRLLAPRGVKQAVSLPHVRHAQRLRESLAAMKNLMGLGRYDVSPSVLPVFLVFANGKIGRFSTGISASCQWSGRAGRRKTVIRGWYSPSRRWRLSFDYILVLVGLCGRATSVAFPPHTHRQTPRYRACSSPAFSSFFYNPR